MDRTLLISSTTYPVLDVTNTDEAYLNERFQLLADRGIEAIDWADDFETEPYQIAKGEVNHFWDKNLDELYAFFAPTKAAAQRSGVAFAQMHSVFPVYVDGKDEMNEYLVRAVEKTLALAAYFDCPALVVHPFTCTDKEHEIAVNLAFYRRLIPSAKQYGVKICLENMFVVRNGLVRDGACADADETCWYIDTLNEEAGADVFGYCLDIGHANLLRKELKSFILKLDKRLTCLHIHDNNGQFDTHVMPFTQSASGAPKPAVEWDSMLAGLREIGYRGHLNFEAGNTFKMFPKELEASVLSMFAAIGSYFRNKILN